MIISWAAFCLHVPGKYLSRGPCQLIAECVSVCGLGGRGVEARCLPAVRGLKSPSPPLIRALRDALFSPKKQTWRGQPCHLLFSPPPLAPANLHSHTHACGWRPWDQLAVGVGPSGWIVMLLSAFCAAFFFFYLHEKDHPNVAAVVVVGSKQVFAC